MRLRMGPFSRAEVTQGRTAAQGVPTGEESSSGCPHRRGEQLRVTPQERTAAQGDPTGDCPSSGVSQHVSLSVSSCWGLLFLGPPRQCFQAGSGTSHGAVLCSEHPGSFQPGLAGHSWFSTPGG